MRFSSRIGASCLALCAGTTVSLSQSGFPSIVDLGGLSEPDGITIEGAIAGSRSGWSVASAGDVDGDQINDVIIAAPFGCECYVVFGGSNLATPLDLQSLDGLNGFTVRLSAGCASVFSLAVAGAADLNCDGVSDIAIGSGSSGSNAEGETYVVFGRDTALAGSFPPSIDVDDLDGTNGFTLRGRFENDFSGRSVASAGDINGDGAHDLLIGASGASPKLRLLAGEAYVVFGSPSIGATGELALASLDGSNGFVIEGFSIAGACGQSVAGAGDVNGDGLDDLIVGAPYAYPLGLGQEGESYVVFGGAGVGSSGTFDLALLDGHIGFSIAGAGTSDFSGWSVAGLGDVNGDQVSDVLVGAFGADHFGLADAGESYVVFGRDSLAAKLFPPQVQAGSLDGSDGFVLRGLGPDDQCGRAVGGAGDINGDGLADLIIGAYTADPDGRADAGEAYVVLGDPQLGDAGAVDLSTLDGSDGFVIRGADPNDRVGVSVAGAGDVNDDGVEDVIVGALWGDPNGRIDAGESFVVFGNPLECEGDLDGDGDTDVFDFADLASNFGAGPGASREQGDVTGDGFVDVFDFADLASDFGCTP